MYRTIPEMQGAKVRYRVLFDWTACYWPTIAPLFFLLGLPLVLSQFKAEDPPRLLISTPRTPTNKVRFLPSVLIRLDCTS